MQIAVARDGLDALGTPQGPRHVGVRLMCGRDALAPAMRALHAARMRPPGRSVANVGQSPSGHDRYRSVAGGGLVLASGHGNDTIRFQRQSVNGQVPERAKAAGKNPASSGTWAVVPVPVDRT